MVFKEDMINKYLVITKVFLFYFFISSCSYKFENSESSNLENVKTISLNVNSLVINKNILGNKEQDFLIEEINRILEKSEAGSVNHIPKGFKSGSDVGNLSVLGYNPVKFFHILP